MGRGKTRLSPGVFCSAIAITLAPFGKDGSKVLLVWQGDKRENPARVIEGCGDAAQAGWPSAGVVAQGSE